MNTHGIFIAFVILIVVLLAVVLTQVQRITKSNPVERLKTWQSEPKKYHRGRFIIFCQVNDGWLQHLTVIRNPAINISTIGILQKRIKWKRKL